MKLTRMSLPTMLVAALAVSPLAASPAFAAGGPPPAATAFTGGVITPTGGTLNGFGITVSFGSGAVSSDRYIILGNWPNGQDSPPPSGQAVKTFGLQECAIDPSTGGPASGTCTSEFGNYPGTQAGSENLRGQQISYTGYQSPTSNTFGNTNFGTMSGKLVTITIDTGGDAVYIYNPNPNPAFTYKELTSKSGSGQLTFQTFQPIVWTVTSPAAGS